MKQNKIENISKRNTFAFEGGKDLTTMGASWFISYLYHKEIDSKHCNWEKVKTTNDRIRVFTRTQKCPIPKNVSMHLHYIQEISRMSPKRLSTNSIGLSGEQVIAMAKELLKQKSAHL